MTDKLQPDQRERAVEQVLREHFGHLIGSDEYIRRAAREIVSVAHDEEEQR